MTFVDRQPLAALAKEVQNNVEAHLSGDQTARSKLLASTEALHRIVEGPSDYVVRLRQRVQCPQRSVDAPQI